MSCLVVYICGIILLVNSALSVPVQQATTEHSVTTDSEDVTTEFSNKTQNLYVIRSVVYEIGILTDGDDSDASNETHEQVDVSFFDPEHNGSFIDLSHIPVPIQTNVSGVIVTGILPSDLGSILLNDNGTASYNGSSFPVLPNAEVTVTHNISTIDKDQSASILSGLPDILGLDNIVTPTNATEKLNNKENADEEGTKTNDVKEAKSDDDKEIKTDDEKEAR